MTEYKKPKKIKTPPLFYFLKKANSTRPQLQIDLIKDVGNIVKLSHFLPTLAIYHPDYAKHILLTNQQNYIKSDVNFRALADIIGQGIVTNNGKKWKSQRDNLAPLFQPRVITNQLPTLVHHIKEMAIRWQHFANNKKKINLTDEIMKLLLKTAMKNFMNEEINDKNSDDTILLSKMMNVYVGKFHYLFKFLPLPSHYKLRKIKKNIDAYLLSIIHKRKQQTSWPEDLLTQLLKMKDEDQKELTQTDLLAELTTLLIASIESLSHTLSWAWYYLLHHPQVFEKIKNEIKENYNLQHFNSEFELPYTKAMIEETLRISTPAWILTRRALKEDYIDGYTIPANTNLFIYIYALHHHPDFWETPEKFIPERFLDENRKKIIRHSYIPFGIGPRNCIAGYTAIKQAQVILAELLTRFNYKFDPSQRIESQVLVTRGIKKGLWVSITS